LRLNLTALVDVTILVLTFFMVVNQFASAERIETVEVPQPQQSVARDKRIAEAVVINLLDRGPGQPAGLQIGPIAVASVDELASRLKAARKSSPGIEVILRADRRLPYREVREVMTLLGEQEISRFHVVAREGTEP
jgi:biopolymer transport protein ExbD